MSNRETELLHIIRGADDPEAALKTAAEIIIAFLAQHESCREPSAGCPPVPA